MADEKKKGGFWSWLGLGKNKQENQPETETQAAESVQAAEGNDSLEHQVEAKTEELVEFIEQEIEREKTALVVEVEANEVEAEIKPIYEQENAAVADIVTEINQIPTTLDEADSTNNEQPQAEIITTTEQQAEQAIAQQEQENDEIQSAVENFAENEAETEQTEQQAEIETARQTIPESARTQEKPSEGGFFSRLVKGLLKTKQNMGDGFRNLFFGKKIDDELFDELEEQLLVADIGMPTTTKIINNLTQHASRQQLKDAELLYQQLKAELADILKPVEQPLEIDSSKKPYVILMVGVNGVGKTTTIGKLAHQFQQQGKSVMLAAGDTFRAAAVEQLQVWGERNHIPVVAQSTGSDSASVIFDAMQSAAARNTDILIADTAGRLQNKNNLMDELKKIVRVMKKYDETAPHEIMLTLDAGTGQNAISQAKLFNEAVGLTGISLTKLDGTAKGGVIFAIADQFNLPIRYIGVGEKIEDLRPFQAREFIDALFTPNE